MKYQPVDCDLEDSRQAAFGFSPGEKKKDKQHKNHYFKTESTSAQRGKPPASSGAI